MKKAFALFIVFAVLLTSGAVWTFADAYKQQDNVIFTENTVYGDIKYADGISVQRRINLGRAQWESICRINEGVVSAETDFHYYNLGINYSDGPSYDSVSLSTVDYPTFAGVGGGKTLTEERQKLQDDFDELTKESLDDPVVVEFKLNDYYEYYPIGVSLWLPESTNIYCEADYETDSDAVKQFREFFKIPVPQREQTVVEAAVSYRGGGSISTVVDKTDNFAFKTYSAVCENAVYFTFDNKFPDDEEKVDTSLIPGGYGIYRLPYEKSSDEDLLNETIEAKVHADRLEMAYALDDDSCILDMLVSFDKTQIYLLSEENGRYFFTVIDEKTMTDKQRFELPSEYETVYFHSAYENYVVITCYDEYYNSNILLYEINEGVHEKKADICTSYTVFDSKLYWDGERLAAVKKYDAKNDDENLWGHYELHYTCGFTLTVFDSKSVLYCGKYKSSLDAGADPDGSSLYFCSGTYADELDYLVTIG